MMSILEYLEWRCVNVDDHEERMWWIGWEDAYCMGRSYDGWKDIRNSDDGRYEKYANLVCDYLIYVENFSNNVSDHYVHNMPGVSYESDIKGQVRGGSYYE